MWEPMKVRVQRAEFPGGKRVIAISDIHGHGTWLQCLLEKVAFSKDDILVIVGDMLEKGPESLGALRHVMDLTRTHTVYPLIGNVDEWAISKVLADSDVNLYEDAQHMIRSSGGSFVQELCEEAGILLTPESDSASVRRMLREAFAEELAFLYGLPTILETPAYRFIHGGMPNVDPMTLEGQKSRTFTKRDNFLGEGVVFDKYTIVGHWASSLYMRDGMLRHAPDINEAQRILSIDGGCGVQRAGQLNALVINAEQFNWVSYDDLPVRMAKDAQQASTSAHGVTFMDGEVDILERDDGFVYIRKKNTGECLWVPLQCVFYNGDIPYASEATDYRLPVAPGDKLSIILETSRGTFCKKDSVAGWYDGALE